jgi:glutamine phosphoribosylpyrophosphate amidotransferase
MCGVVGVSLTNVNSADIALVQRVMKETQIRGMHASGVAYHNGNNLTRIATSDPITQLVENLDWRELTASGNLNLIAHARYSTSDLEFHQPLGNNDLFISHNGVITQESPDKWEDIYGHVYNTRNDSEILLNKIRSGTEESEISSDLVGASIAVVTIDAAGTVSGWRNSLRPLWRTDLHNGFIYTSTRDIVTRACDSLTPVKMESVDGAEHQSR